MVWEEDRENIQAHPDAIEARAEDIRAERVRVAVGEGRLLGFSTVLATEEDRGELDALFVEPEVMRRGVGRMLLDDAVSIARERGLHRIEVTANPRAVAFYRRAGFVADGEVPTRFRPGLRMH